MEKIVILNANNESMQVEVVRYIAEGNNKYFIFSLHELDTQGHMDIYVTKIVNQNGILVGTNIIDDVEWQNLRNNLQRIIKENRANGNAIVNDLPYNELQNVKVADRRALRLLATSVDMLNLGYNPQATINNSVPEPTNNSFAQPNVQNNVQNMNIPQNNLDIFNGNVQNPNNMNYYQQPMQQPVDQQQTVQPQVQQPTEQQPFQQEMQWNMPQSFQQPTQQQFQQPMQQQFQQPVQPQMQQQFQQPVQNSVDNSTSENYKELYFNEKSKNEQLTAENNQLVNELNNCKMMISDIQNILSRQ